MTNLRLSRLGNALVLFIFHVILLQFVYSQPQPVATDNCIQLAQSASSGPTCQKCLQGFYLQYFLCLPCAPLCTCTSQYNYCQTCMNITYKSTMVKLAYYSASAQRCLLCQATMPFCLTCNNLQNCTQCFGGRYLVLNQSNRFICSQNLCQDNCQICDSPTTCKQCVDGAYLNPSAKFCTPNCSANCLNCSSLTTCNNCNPGYFVNSSNNCGQCIQNCMVCNSTFTCTNCFPGYFLQNNTCQSTGFSNCVAYVGGEANPSNCMVCEPGYYVAFGSCNQCTGCDLCNLGFLCLTPCQQGTTPFNYACLVPNFGQKILYLVTLVFFCLLL